MADYSEPIGRGGIWVKEGKKGKYLSWEATFAYNGHQVTAKGVAFKNDNKQGNQPDYTMKVNDAMPAKSREDKSKPKEKEDLPF
jgi:hypothetical protein